MIIVALVALLVGAYCMQQEWHVGTIICVGILIGALQAASSAP